VRLTSFSYRAYLPPVRAPFHSLFSLSVPVVLAIAFAVVYAALGPGNFFSVDEVLVQEMAQAVYQRGTLEVPAMNTAIRGSEDAYYAHRGPALAYIALPLVALGNLLDELAGSMNGGAAAGPPLGTVEHPLRWGGRLAIFTALITNAVAGGMTVALLYLISLRLGVAHKVALSFGISMGVATLLASESTHFFQHPLESLTLLLGFWFLSSRDPQTAHRDAWFGGLSLGLALLSRPNTLPAAVVIWVYGAIVASAKTDPEIRRSWLRIVARSSAGPATGAFLYLMYNYVQFGNVLDSGYGDEQGILRLTLIGPVRALIAYLFSPSLSLFLFAPVLLMIPMTWRESLTRWPLETKCIALASIVHFVPIALVPEWDGAISYGPRYMLAPMLFLSLTALPAFEKAFTGRRRNWLFTIVTLVMFGACIQLAGMSVYVATNEWYYNAQNIYRDRAFIFLPYASPVVVHLRDLAAGRNLAPWALRAISEPGPALFFLMSLGLAGVASFRHLWMTRDGVSESHLPKAAVAAMSLLIVYGFASTSPVRTPIQSRIVENTVAGLMLQEAGRDVESQELSALVLTQDPGNKFALHNLAVLHEKTGNAGEAKLLYERALATDPSFAPSANKLSNYQQTIFSLTTQAQDCASARECYEAGKRIWDLGGKAPALTIWEQAGLRYPEEAWLIRNVGRARYDLADFEGAARDYRKALDLSPGDNGIRTDLAWALLAASQINEARQLCLEVLAEDPSNEAARAILARLR
jgi:tetratricopeptide (TPR) repeat protein